jgi:sugar phosphate isomerase/epimerase
VYVACSLLCFSRRPLDQALRTIADLGFNKVDVALHARGPHLTPSQVAADVGAAGASLRVGPGVSPAAFSVEIEADDEADYQKQLRAVCRLARLSTAPLLTVPAAKAGTPVDAEVRRLGKLVGVCEREGILLTVDTRLGTLTEDPDTAVLLCQEVPGLGLTLDPSPYIAGPHRDKPLDDLFQFVRHVHLRDTGRGPDQYQVRVGQGEVEYGRLISQLARFNYNRLLTVDIRDSADPPFPMEPEVRKLKYLLESLV